MAPTRTAPRYPIESVDNALRLLLLLREGPPLTVQRASAELGVAPSTAHRLLAMLLHRGFVEQDPTTRAYRAGPVLTDVGLAAIQELDIRRAARPYLERLVAKLDETAHLTVLRGTSVLFIDGVESSRILRAAARVGHSLPAHATASGTVMLAELPEQEVQRLYPRDRLERITRHTITSRRALLRRLAEIHERGYALNRGESEDDVVAVAAAIRESGGALHGAITLAGPATRFDVERAARAAPRVRSAAAAVAEALRWDAG
jgi:IclR family acetate operon transcriptional repressor